MRRRSPEDEIYLVWSQEMKAWWGADARSYVKLAQAGRFHRTEAIRLCAGAVLTAGAGALPECRCGSSMSSAPSQPTR